MKSPKFSRIFHFWLVIVGLPLFIASLATIYPAPFTSETVKKWTENIETDEWLMYFLKSENQLFYKEKASVDFGHFSKLAFKLSTNIQPEDIRTFLGRELPGFTVFDTDIVVAGQGTNYTTLPIESAPPIDVLLQEREIAREMLKEDGGNIPAAAGEKAVFIYHSHSWESFLPLLKGAKDINDATSNNPKANILAVGNKLAEELNKKGIATLHDTTNMTNLLKENNLNTNKSYGMSRKIVQETLGSNDDIQYLIDIHRDSQRKAETTQMINGKPYARVFFVVGEANKNYEQNLKVATDLHQLLEEKYPEISRGIVKKGLTEGNGIYNQDLSNGALLIEFGGVDNNMTELYNTIEAFAEIFSDYYWKAERVNGG